MAGIVINIDLNICEHAIFIRNKKLYVHHNLRPSDVLVVPAGPNSVGGIIGFGGEHA